MRKAAPRGTRTDAVDGRLTEAFDMRLDEPKKAARAIVRATLRGARDVYPHGPERLLMLIQRLLPTVVDSLVTRQFEMSTSTASWL